MDFLTDSQRAAVDQLHAIIDGGDRESEIEILRSVNWDVQRAVEHIFDSPRKMEQMEIDDSATTSNNDNNAAAYPRPRYTLAPYMVYLSRLAQLIAFPFALTLNLFAYVLRLLRFPVPRLTSRPFALNWTAFSSIWSPKKRENPGVVADRWVRQLEEELGALTLARARSADAGRNEGPSSRSSVERAVIPDFYLGSYEDALNVAKRELRVLCVILVSEEHDDVPAFKRETLTDPNLNRLFADENFVVWGGDVTDLEPYSASLKLGTTTYPFIAFIALQPSRIPSSSTGSSNNSTRSTLSVLSRHSGPTQTAPVTLIQHLTSTLLPRVKPVLERYRREEMNRVEERRQREESERRAQESAFRDGERILRAREDERRRKAEEEERVVQARRKANRDAARIKFWVWAARELVPPEPIAGDPSIRITLRLPDGTRLIRRFDGKQGVSALYAFVAGQLSTASSSGSPERPSSLDFNLREDGWGFGLATSYPRIPIPWQPLGQLDADAIGNGGASLTEVAGGVLKAGGMVVVEVSNGLELTVAGSSETRDNQDEYLSEEE